MLNLKVEPSYCLLTDSELDEAADRFKLIIKKDRIKAGKIASDVQDGVDKEGFKLWITKLNHSLSYTSKLAKVYRAYRERGNKFKMSGTQLFELTYVSDPDIRDKLEQAIFEVQNETSKTINVMMIRECKQFLKNNKVASVESVKQKLKNIIIKPKLKSKPRPKLKAVPSNVIAKPIDYIGGFNIAIMRAARIVWEADEISAKEFADSFKGSDHEERARFDTFKHKFTMICEQIESNIQKEI